MIELIVVFCGRNPVGPYVDLDHNSNAVACSCSANLVTCPCSVGDKEDGQTITAEPDLESEYWRHACHTDTKGKPGAARKKARKRVYRSITETAFKNGVIAEGEPLPQRVIDKVEFGYETY